MEEATELANYLPLSFKTPTEQEYIAFLWDAFESNYASAKYQFAFLAYHMLTMSFVYFKIWQIKAIFPADFTKALVGFHKDVEKDLTAATNPFVFSTVSESVVLRFLKLIECDNAKIGNYAKLVQERNDTAHSNGNIYFSEQSALDQKIGEVLRVVDEIHHHSVPMIATCYRRFLEESQDPETREYPSDEEQIQEVLVHKNYLSQKDVIACASSDPSPYYSAEEAGEMKLLHSSFRLQYADILNEDDVA